VGDSAESFYIAPGTPTLLIVNYLDPTSDIFAAIQGSPAQPFLLR